MVLRINDLSAQRGERVLFEGLNAAVNSGSCLHIVGANGSGKTTLLRMLAGLIYVDQGEISWQGKVIRNNPVYLETAVYLGHSDGLKNELTAAENLLFFHQLDGVESDLDLVDQHLAAMGILATADLTANKLSFGQRRRLAFARLLAKNAQLWILDEPFTGIDHAGRQLIEGLCQAHLEQNGLIVLTNHRSLQDSLVAAHLNELRLSDFSSRGEPA